MSRDLQGATLRRLLEQAAERIAMQIALNDDGRTDPLLADIYAALSLPSATESTEAALRERLRATDITYGAVEEMHSATRERRERCKTEGHVWVGIGDEGKVVCDDCGIEKQPEAHTCSGCGGNGRVPPYSATACKTCKGTGIVLTPPESGSKA